jgi:polyisoprenoid-binding protein YceI
MLKRTVLAVTLALVPMLSAHAQPAPPAPPPAGVYSVEPHHTQVMFGISHLGFSTSTAPSRGQAAR